MSMEELQLEYSFCCLFSLPSENLFKRFPRESLFILLMFRLATSTFPIGPLVLFLIFNLLLAWSLRSFSLLILFAIKLP